MLLHHDFGGPVGSNRSGAITGYSLCQANVEVYQSEINKKKGTKLNMPVLYYSQLMTVAYGGTIKDAGLDGQLIRAEKLEAITRK